MEDLISGSLENMTKNLYDTTLHSLFCAVIAALRTPARRIFFALALSAMIHAAIIWLPNLRFPQAVHLPPLTVRLEVSPLPAAQPATKPEPVQQAGQPGGSTLGKPISNTAARMKEMEKSTAIHQFPKHLQLVFTVYQGAGLSMVGKLYQQLDIYGDKYTLKATTQIDGQAGLQNNDQLIQASYGKIDEHGLRPEAFKEEKITGSGKHDLEATFDWPAQKLIFSHGGDNALPADAQDILSFMYQLSQLSMQAEIIPLDISDGTKLEQNQIEIGITEDISTPMGKLRAVHLRKMHAQGEAYFEIWLGLEYSMLPVKFHRVDGSGGVTEEFVISDIRASD